MIRFFKILVPIVLSVAILLSIGWYLIKYDPEFTRDVLVTQARIQSDNGNHKISTWLYELAYKHSGNDTSVALELADQFKEVGNYTKAEYTLSHAIADGGSIELYIALCQTYVEQDKLLDAVSMLDRIADPIIKEQIHALRPQAPIASPEQGFYDQYITVTLQSDSGLIYATTNGEYPSTEKDIYSTAVTLPAGKTTIYALTVSDSGLVSPLAIYSYTISGVIEEVTLSDPAIDQAVREILAVDQEYTFHSDDLWMITDLELPAATTTLEDLKWFPFLHTLTIQDCSPDSLAFLQNISSLQTLTVTNTPVLSEDLSAIASLPKLTHLTLQNCNLSNIDNLSAATNLRYLDLSHNAIGKLDALAGMTNLEHINLSHNAIRDYPPKTEEDSTSDSDTSPCLQVFGAMPNLTVLDLSYNSITTPAPLSSCKALKKLDFTSNELKNISGISELSNLTYLSLAFNAIENVSPLSVITSLEHLDISSNLLGSIIDLGSLNSLMTFNFSNNSIIDLPTFSRNSSLVSINGSNNQITNLDPLQGLSNLNYVIMHDNPALESIDPLATCERLVEVNVYNTGVTDVSAVTKTKDGKDTGITVIYKYPTN